MKKEVGILFTDLHLNDLNGEICLSFIEKLKDYIIKNNSKNLFFLGDFFDTRKGLSEPTLRIAKVIFKILRGTGINIYFLSGNHDKYNQNSLYSYLDTFKRYTTFLAREIEVISDSDIDYFLFPYFEIKKGEESSIYKEQLEKLSNLIKKSNAKYKILLSHYMAEEIPSEISKDLNRIFLGHFHEKQVIIDKKTEYIGSCFQQNFSEDNNKGFTILYEDLSIKQISFEYKEYITQVVDLNVFSEEEAKKFIISFKEKYENTKFLRIELRGFHKNTSDLVNFCKNNNINCISKVENNIFKDTTNQSIYFSAVSDSDFKNYYKDFCKSQNVEEEVSNCLKEYIYGIK